MDTFTCSRCNREKSLDLFPRARGRRNGTRCKCCEADIRNAKRVPKPKPLRDYERTSKVCNRCGVDRPISDYYWVGTKVGTPCKHCISERNRATRAALPKKPRPTLEERFWSKVDTSGECWIWTGAKNSDGYGLLLVDGRARNAHGIAYTLAGSVVPDGMELDHLCRNRACVNPAHLEPVTHQVNTQRGAQYRAYVRKPHCKHGHAYTAENTIYRRDGSRACRACGRQTDHRYYLNRKVRASQCG